MTLLQSYKVFLCIVSFLKFERENFDNWKSKIFTDLKGLFLTVT
jgi:hypothetical protein